MAPQSERLIEALEIIAAELERLRLLKERELDARIEYEGGAPYIVPREPAEK